MKWLGKPQEETPENEVMDVKHHLTDAHNERDADIKLEKCNKLISPAEPATGFIPLK